MSEILVAFDVETTGLSPTKDKIVEMAAVKFRANGEILDSFASLTDPGMPIPPQATKAHRITDDMVAGKPLPLQVWEHILGWVDEPIFVAHNAPFDAGFVQNLGSGHAKMSDVEFIDTLKMSREKLDRDSYRLDALVPRPREQSHRALDDAKAVVWLFSQLMAMDGAVRTLPAYTEHIDDIEEPEPTINQLEYIESLGGDPAQVSTKQEASDYIDRLLQAGRRVSRLAYDEKSAHSEYVDKLAHGESGNRSRPSSNDEGAKQEGEPRREEAPQWEMPWTTALVVVVVAFLLVKCSL